MGFFKYQRGKIEKSTAKPKVCDRDKSDGSVTPEVSPDEKPSEKSRNSDNGKR